MDFLYPIFYARLWRLALARGVLFLLPAEYSAVMCGAWPCRNLSDLTVAST